MKKIKEIEELQVKINDLRMKQNKIIEDEEDKVQKPRCRKMKGWYLKHKESKNMYAKILDTVETKDGSFFFILERIHLFDNGGGQIHTTSESPYLNKEWWKSEIPLWGWKKCTENEYVSTKMKIFDEMENNNTLKKFLFNHNK